MLTLTRVRPVSVLVKTGNASIRVVVYADKDWTINEIKKSYEDLNPTATFEVVNREIQLDLLVDNNDV